MTGFGSRSKPGRRVINPRETAFEDYDLEGPVQPEMSWLPVSYDRATEEGSYFMRLSPGAVTISHEHAGFEEFLVLEGSLEDDDGTLYRTGDFVSLAPGTRHHSRSRDGCLILVFEWGKDGRRNG